jgi:hypothetical protein
MDISPIQPDNRPANVEWLLHDVETEWPFPKAHFNYVRLSLLNGSLADLVSLVQKIMQYVLTEHMNKDHHINRRQDVSSLAVTSNIKNTLSVMHMSWTSITSRSIYRIMSTSYLPS